MPLLFDDPPGRALMSYRPVESLDDPRGWASETTYLLGTDGGWRRLAMADLGLAEEWWPGPDTYGAGQVSPDGRWWALHVGPNVLLMNLRTGEHRLAHLGDDAVGAVRAVAAGQAAVCRRSRVRASGHLGVSSTHLVDVTGKVRESPYGRFAVAYQPDGTAMRFTATHRLRWAEGSTKPTRDRVPGFWHAQRRSWTFQHGERLSIVPDLPRASRRWTTCSPWTRSPWCRWRDWSTGAAATWDRREPRHQLRLARRRDPADLHLVLVGDVDPRGRRADVAWCGCRGCLRTSGPVGMRALPSTCLGRGVRPAGGRRLRRRLRPSPGGSVCRCRGT